MPMSPRLLRPRASTAFDPRSITGLAVWLDAADATTLFQNSNATTAAAANNDPVGCWANKAGSPNAIQATNLNRPQYKPASQSGRGTVSLDGVNGFLTLAYDLVSPFTLISVQKIDAATGPAFPVIGNLQNSGSFDGLLHAHAINTNSTTLATRIRVSAATLATGELNVGTSWFTWTTTASGATFRARANGSQLTEGSGTYSARDSTLIIGRGRTGDPANIRALSFAEVLVYSRLLTSEEIAAVEQYVRGKWSLP